MATQIPDGSTDYIWQGSQLMEERNSSNAPIRQYVWGTYPGAAVLTGPSAQTGFRPQNAGLGGLNVDECVQLTTFAALGSQNLAPGSYYLLQDLLYRAVALTNSSGTVVETYDTDAYGNTIIFTAPGTDGVWFTDDDVQSSYGANEIICCGYRFDPEKDLYYVRNRTYNPVLGRWVQRDPIGYSGGINLYEYVVSNPVESVDPEGLSGIWSIITSPFEWVKKTVDGAADWMYAAWMAQNNSGANANYYDQIMYGHNLPPNLCVGTPVQQQNLSNALPAFRNLGTGIPGTSASPGLPDFPTTVGDYVKSLGKEQIKKQLSK